MPLSGVFAQPHRLELHSSSIELLGLLELLAECLAAPQPTGHFHNSVQASETAGRHPELIPDAITHATPQASVPAVAVFE